MSASTIPAAPPSGGGAGAAPPKGPPKFLPLILFLFLPIYFSLCFAPLLAATADLQVSNLNIAVASFDTGSPLEAAFMGFFTALSMKGRTSTPTLNILTGSSTSPSQLHHDVAGIEAWGTIFLNQGAYANAVAALRNPSWGNYTAASAITFEFNEGRSQVSPYVNGYGRSVLDAFVESTAATLATQIASGQLTGINVTNVALTTPQLLVEPVGYSVEIVCGSADLSLGFMALTLGNILMAVFSLAVTNIILGPLTPFLLKGRTPVGGTSMRILAMIAFTAVIPLAFTSIATGLGGLSASAFFRIWAIFWLAMLGYVSYFMFFAVLAGSPAVVPLFLLPLITFNSLGGWNTDLAPPSYYFFRYAPFYHTSVLARNVLFKAYPGRQGISIAVLFAWLVLFFVPFVIVSVHKLGKMQAAMKAAALKALSDAQAATKSASGPAATASVELASPTRASLPAPQSSPASTSSASAPAPHDDSVLASKGYTAVQSPASIDADAASPQAEIASPPAVAVDVPASLPSGPN